MRLFLVAQNGLTHAPSVAKSTILRQNKNAVATQSSTSINVRLAMRETLQVVAIGSIMAIPFLFDFFMRG
jgi:hypothetical protein